MLLCIDASHNRLDQVLCIQSNGVLSVFLLMNLAKIGTRSRMLLFIFFYFYNIYLYVKVLLAYYQKPSAVSVYRVKAHCC